MSECGPPIPDDVSPHEDHPGSDDGEERLQGHVVLQALDRQPLNQNIIEIGDN